MHKWSAFLLSGALVIAFVVGLFVQPLDTEANPSTFWRASFYNNTDLQGEPVVTRHDRAVSFNWSTEAPASELPVDGFSARWVASFDFDGGDWHFVAGADDGIRLWLDDNLLIDHWTPNGDFVMYEVTTQVEPGLHTIKVDYFDAAGFAGIRVDWEPVSDDKSIAPELPADPINQDDPDAGPPADAFAHVAVDRLNVREGPSIQYRRIDQVFLYQRFPILGQNAAGTWYKIDLKDGSEGWVSVNYVYFTGSSPIPVLDAPEVDPSFDSIPGVALDQLNLRAQPSSRSTQLGLVVYGTTFDILGRDASGAWYFIQVDEETEGWVFAPFVDLQGFPAYDIPYANTDEVDLAEGPAIEDDTKLPEPEVIPPGSGKAKYEVVIRQSPITGDRIGVVPQNALVEVQARNLDGAWYLIVYNNIQGWVYSPFIELGMPVSAVPIQ